MTGHDGRQTEYGVGKQVALFPPEALPCRPCEWEAATESAAQQRGSPQQVNTPYGAVASGIPAPHAPILRPSCSQCREKLPTAPYEYSEHTAAESLPLCPCAPGCYPPRRLPTQAGRLAGSQVTRSLGRQVRNCTLAGASPTPTAEKTTTCPILGDAHPLKQRRQAPRPL